MRTVCRLVKLLHSHLYAGLPYLIQSRKKPMSRQLNEKLTSKYVYISNKKKMIIGLQLNGWHTKGGWSAFAELDSENIWRIMFGWALDFLVQP